MKPECLGSTRPFFHSEKFCLYEKIVIFWEVKIIIIITIKNSLPVTKAVKEVKEDCKEEKKRQRNKEEADTWDHIIFIPNK